MVSITYLEHISDLEDNEEEDRQGKHTFSTLSVQPARDFDGAFEKHCTGSQHVGHSGGKLHDFRGGKLVL